ncbi:MAG: sodium:proton exchanger [Bacteroidetes bacterium CG12_big_fil_rev_8_21_14_0_65_60_17]|nr:MAG: sodium:proton exchanger [Bacteroidetes bacterium CG12_big_fil_rev_8_21_14_0_65_60_17]
MLPLAVNLAFLGEIVVLFVAAVVMAYLSYRIGLVPIVGFLITGVIIGPTALGLVSDQELVDVLAEVGVILLLFTIGLEFSLEKLSRLARAIFVAGTLQGASVVVIVTGAAIAFGTGLNVGIYTGFLVALSSTAIVLGLLTDRKETDTPQGRLSLSILIFQDFSIVGMVLLVPLLSGEGGSTIELLWILLRAVLIIVAIVVLARRTVPWVLEKVARTGRQELFLLTVVTICLGTAALVSQFGVSLALGAFMAGLVVSESHYSEQALSEILPLRTIFNVVFFVSVGMLLDVSFLVDNLVIVLLVGLAILVLKIITTSASVLVLGYPMRISAAVGFGLAQIGEFSFVLERAGRPAGLSPAGMGDAGTQIFIAATVLLMLVTPFQLQGSARFGEFVARVLPGRRGVRGRDSDARPDSGRGDSASAQSDARGDEKETPHLEDHAIIVGYGQAGKRLVQVLQNRGIPFMVIEMNPDAVSKMRSQDIPALYGDASRAHILEAAGIHEAKMCVVVVNDPAITPRITQQARYLNPTLQIVVRTRYLVDMERLQSVGADIVVPEEMETTVRIFSHVLGAYMIPPDEIDRQIKLLRKEDYGIVRGSIQEAHLMVLEGLDEDGLHTRAVAVREGAFAADRSLSELELRRRYGLTVLAVRRAGKTTASPSGEFTLRAGDRLVMVGSADRFARCADIFRVPDAAP